jgi:peptidoglycan/LPS O-acetylase OafA/YrhL
MRRFAWFDSVRFLAIFLVMLSHAGDLSGSLPAWVVPAFTQLQLASWVGVDLFFVLSGFLVSGLLFDEHDSTGKLNITRFLIRRAFKIVPAFYVLVLITAIYDFINDGKISGAHLFHDLLFLQNYRMGAWPHAWTLAIEVHFYILLAILLHYLSRMPPKTGSWLARLPAIIVGVLVASFLARLINSGVRTGHFNPHSEFWPSHLHLDVLAAGVLLRYIYIYHAEMLAIFRRTKLLWMGVGLLLVYPSQFIWLQPHSALLTAIIPTCDYLGFSLILFEVTQIPFPVSGVGAWLVRPFDYLGKHSYSIYLWHLPVNDWIIKRIFSEPSPVSFLSFVVISLAVGTFFSVILEMPVLHLRNRLFPSSTSRAQPRPDTGPATVVVRIAGD